MGGLLLGLDRKAAAEFSFFLAIPTMLGAGALDLYKGWSQIDASLALDIAVASLAAFVTAIVVVRAFVNFLARHDFMPFGWYRIAAGLVMLGLLLTTGRLTTQFGLGAGLAPAMPAACRFSPRAWARRQRSGRVARRGGSAELRARSWPVGRSFGAGAAACHGLAGLPAPSEAMRFFISSISVAGLLAGRLEGALRLLLQGRDLRCATHQAPRGSWRRTR